MGSPFFAADICSAAAAVEAAAAFSAAAACLPLTAFKLSIAWTVNIDPNL